MLPGAALYHQHLTEAARLSHELMSNDALRAELEATANQLARPGRGLLAADESVGTIGKRLVAAGLENEEETRRAYREVLFAHPDLGQYLSGAILHSETLGQTAADGTPFPELLKAKGVLPGVKVDTGLEPLGEFSPRETHTKGMDDLLERCKGYYDQGARFAKWRAVIRIDEETNLPTRACIQLNSAELTQYAAVCQACGLVPIVEPEILIEGSHSAETFARVTEAVLSEVYYALAQAKVFLEGTLLKPQMIMAGVDAPADGKPAPEVTAKRTLEVLRRRVPPAVPGVMFLSGGQTEEEATWNLNLINQLAQQPPHPGRAAPNCPWVLSFSFGRSLQASVLATWQGKAENFDAAVAVAGALAKANSEAQLGKFEGPHPSVLQGKSLHETHRGWGGANGGPAEGAAEAAPVEGGDGAATKEGEENGEAAAAPAAASSS